MQRSTKFKLALLAVFVPLALGAASIDDADERYTRLTLNGTGYAEQATEYVTLTAGTDTFSTSASRAMSENARDMASLRSKLARLGVAEADFQTGNFRFQQGRDPDDEDGSDRARGYIVEHQLNVTVRDVDNLGKAMDALVGAGAKNLSINRYWGYREEPSPESLKRARADAIRDAQAKADDYARALGMRIRRVVSVSDGGGYTRDRPAPAMIAARDVATQIDTRPATVLASVGMVFELEK